MRLASSLLDDGTLDTGSEIRWRGACEKAGLTLTLHEPCLSQPLRALGQGWQGAD